MVNEQEASDIQYADSSNLAKRMALFENGEAGSLWQTLWSFYDFQPDNNILEIGCGNGQFWLENISKISKFTDITLSDLSEGMLADARERLGDKHFSYDIQDASHLTYADTTFDCVISHFVFYHVTDPQKAFQHVARVLKPNGFFGMVLPTRNTPKEKVIHSKELSLAFSMLPELEEVFLRTSTISFFSNEAEVLFDKFFTSLETLPLPGTLVLDDVEKVIGFLLSLPAFQTDIVDELFINEYRKSN